jgi:hypothetical protein
MKRYLVINNSTGIVENVILWDGLSDFNPGEGKSLEIIPAGSSAWTGYKKIGDGEFVLIEGEVIEDPETGKFVAPVIEDLPVE